MRAREFISEDIINYQNVSLPDTNKLDDVSIDGINVDKIATYSKGLDAYKQQKNDGIVYFITVDNIPVGKIFLKPTQILGKTFDNIYLIYVVPEYRKTKIIFNLLTIAKQYKNNPLIIEGVMFKDGVSLIRSLIKSHNFTIKTLDMITGKISTKVDQSVPTQFDICYLIE